MTEKLKNSTRDEEDAKAAKSAAMEREVRPCGDRCFCRLEVKDEMQGNIIIPATVGDTQREAIVVSTGPGRTTEEGELVPMKIKPGMRVMLPMFGGADLKITGQKYQFVFEKDVIAIMSDEGE